MDWLLNVDFPTRLNCLGDPLLVWAIAAADMLLFVSYVVIASLIFLWIKPRHIDRLQNWFWFFGLFVYACGLTHLTSFLLAFWPAYNLHLVVNVMAAAVSAAAMVMLVTLIPVVLRYPPAGKMDTTRKALSEEMFRLREVQNGGEGLKLLESTVKQLKDIVDKSKDSEKAQRV